MELSSPKIHMTQNSYDVVLTSSTSECGSIWGRAFHGAPVWLFFNGHPRGLGNQQEGTAGLKRVKG